MLLAAAFSASGCSGGGDGGRAGSPTTATSAAQTALVQFTIVVPAPPSSKARRPAYVSSSTKSATITVAPGNTSTTVNCTNVCSASIAAPLGTDTFTVNLYDGTNGTGNLLSTGTFTQTIVAGQNNAVNLTFNGVASSLAIALNPTSVTIGTPATPAVAVTVNALDANGNIIVGPGNYSNVNGNPLTLTLHDSDSSGATQLSVTTLTAPTSGITLSYNGASISNAIISVTAPGLTTAQATLTVSSPATPTPTPTSNPTPKPSPTPTPTSTPTPAPGTVMLSTSSLSLLGTGAANAQTFTASQSNYGGGFTVTTPAGGQPNSCSGIATVSPSSGAGPFSVTGAAAGTCSFTVTGGYGQSAPLTVVVTITTLGGS